VSNELSEPFRGFFCGVWRLLESDRVVGERALSLPYSVGHICSTNKLKAMRVPSFSFLHSPPSTYEPSPEARRPLLKFSPPSALSIIVNHQVFPPAPYSLQAPQMKCIIVEGPSSSPFISSVGPFTLLTCCKLPPRPFLTRGLQRLVLETPSVLCRLYTPQPT